MGRTENFRFNRAEFFFQSERVLMRVRPHDTRTEMGAFSIVVHCCHLDLQVSFVAQISNTLSQIFVAVENLTLAQLHSLAYAFDEHNHVDRAEWLKLLRSFSNVRTLRIQGRLVKKLSRCLRLEDGGHPLELLPELQELTYTGRSDGDDDFTSFIDARQNAGRPVTLINENMRD
jgi:hypothetical protein